MRLALSGACVLALAAAAGPAFADRIENPLALFNGLDKITGVTTSFEVPVNQDTSSAA